MAQLAIAKKDIQTERLTVKAGEPLPSKWQLNSVWAWIRKKFGDDSLEILVDRDMTKLHSIIFERQAQQFKLRIQELETEVAALKAKAKKSSPETGPSAR